MSSSTNRTRTLTTLGILTAIILVMTFTPLGYIKTMGLEITLLHIPVILGAALTGPAAAWCWVQCLALPASFSASA